MHLLECVDAHRELRIRKSGILAFALLACFSPHWSPAQSQQQAKSSEPSKSAALYEASIAELPEGFSEKVVATGITGARR